MVYRVAPPVITIFDQKAVPVGATENPVQVGTNDPDETVIPVAAVRILDPSIAATPALTLESVVSLALPSSIAPEVVRLARVPTLVSDEFTTFAARVVPVKVPAAAAIAGDEVFASERIPTLTVVSGLGRFPESLTTVTVVSDAAKELAVIVEYPVDPPVALILLPTL
jgi:hypothetical protein